MSSNLWSEVNQPDAKVGGWCLNLTWTQEATQNTMRNQRIREWQKLENTLGLFKPKTFILQKGKYRPGELTKLSKVISLMVGEELGLEDSCGF